MTRNACIMKRFHLKKKRCGPPGNIKTSLKNDKRNTYCTTWNHKKLSSFTQPRAKHDLCFVRMWVMIAWVTLTFLLRGKKRWKWKERIFLTSPKTSQGWIIMTKIIGWIGFYIFNCQFVSTDMNAWKLLLTKANVFSHLHLLIAFIKEYLFTHYNLLVFKQTMTANTSVLMINYIFCRNCLLFKGYKDHPNL